MRPILGSSVFVHGARQQLPLEVPLPPEAPATPPWAFIQEAESAFAAPAPVDVEEVLEAAPVEVEAPVEPAPEAPEAPVVPTWSSSMTKAELLAVASQLGLAVSSSNTKSEILDALDASKQ